MRLRQADHALELTGGRGDAALGGADVLAELAHGDIGGDEGFGGGRGDGGLDVGAGVGDVGGEEFDGLGWEVLARGFGFGRERVEEGLPGPHLCLRCQACLRGTCRPSGERACDPLTPRCGREQGRPNRIC